MKKHAIAILFTLFVSACSSTPNETERNHQAINLAKQHGWAQLAINTDQFILQAFLPLAPIKVETLSIYLEGDGLAWIKPTIASKNPTPNNPLALKLALLDINPAVYLARPCQYAIADESKNCTQAYWTSHRFSPEVIQSSNQAIDQIKQKFGAKNLILVGYSGGGAVAALVAAKRHDVIKLVTVAGNLDHARWTEQHHLSPLSGSLNPAEAWMDLQEVAQRHYVGDNDATIGKDIAQSYASQFIISKQPSITVIPNFNHNCCWDSIWPSIVSSDFGDLAAIQALQNINASKNKFND